MAVFKKHLGASFGSVGLALVIGLLSVDVALAEKDKKDDAIYEDDLTTTQGLQWGGKKLPFKKTVDIRESLVETPLGKVTADRYLTGNDLDGSIFGRSSQPAPGRSAFISLWGSKIEGCFVEVIIQHAPASGRADPTAIIPTLLELGIGSQLIELPPQSKAQPKIFSQDYSYTSFFGEKTTTGTWYMTRNIFVVDSGIAAILAQAPSKDTRARLTLSNGGKILIPIDQKTVSSWKTAYSFNPACKSPTAVQKPTSTQQKPKPQQKTKP
jgi:hypothetical protein